MARSFTQESLEDKKLLSLAKIVGTDVDRLEEENRVMTFHKVEVEGFQCGRCGHKWVPRGSDEEPSVCPKCKSPYWNKPRKRKVKKH